MYSINIPSVVAKCTRNTVACICHRRSDNQRINPTLLIVRKMQMPPCRLREVVLFADLLDLPDTLWIEEA